MTKMSRSLHRGIRAREPVVTPRRKLLIECRLTQHLRPPCAAGAGHVSLQHRAKKEKAHPMAPAAAATTFSSDAPIELREESDFQALLSPDGYISVCGFGSLLSERSARSTFPDLRNFRMAKLHGFRRIFTHVAPIFFERGIAKEETKVYVTSSYEQWDQWFCNLDSTEISSLSVEPFQGQTLVITVFDIEISEVPSFVEREHEFRFLAVLPEEMDGETFVRPAVVCARYSDEEYFYNRCEGSTEIFFQRYGRFNIEKIWRDDILPCRVYLRHCVLAAKNLGEAAYENFLDHTFLADRKTTIRQYLSTTGSGIMEEEPPETLRSRYGG